jgi:hypothetical protein
VFYPELDRTQTNGPRTVARALVAAMQESTMWSWREEAREILWLVLIVAVLSTLAVSLAVAVAVV